MSPLAFVHFGCFLFFLKGTSAENHPLRNLWSLKARVYVNLFHHTTEHISLVYSLLYHLGISSQTIDYLGQG